MRKQLNIPLGYYTEKETRTMTVEQARDWLLTRKQKRCTLAERDGATVTLTSHFIRCPYCYRKIYTYARDINKAFGRYFVPTKRVSKEEVLAWTSQRQSWFRKPVEPLVLNGVIGLSGDLVCPHCKNTMQQTDRTRQVEVWRHRHKVWVRCEILDIKEVFEAPCLASRDVPVNFPLYEAVCFNFRNGHTYLQLETAQGECLAARDITEDKHAWTGGAVYRSLTRNTYVVRAVKNLFRAEWKGDLPFYPSELGVDELRLLTRFRRHTRSFYAAIPFVKGTLAVDRSFQQQARWLRDGNRAVTLYKQSALPQMKSVRKLFFSQTGLFFYLKESERLWQLLGDPNLFVMLFQKRSLYRLLSDLHTRPVVFLFLNEYAAQRGGKILFRLMYARWFRVREYAINYSSLSDDMRRFERAKWNKHDKSFLLDKPTAFSVPMCTPNEQIRACTIDGFTFSWLRTSSDYEEAGKALQNCLLEWSSYRSPVVGIRKDGRIIAAVEVRHRSVFQAYAAHNESLRRVPGLLEAYLKWYTKNGLSEVESDREQDNGFGLCEGDAELPF